MSNNPKIIAGIYEVIKYLKSGTGGDVYLAYHQRLGKQLVIKSDKRVSESTLTSLRREVDALKSLTHTYIPQVYDFVVEDGKVYTVMDFIDGVSLDEPLEKGFTASSAQIVEWARELLEALVYLHSRPPYGILHSDIKPANIMLTADGTIRLVDYNVALALGENGAVMVGASFGYASPEHYEVAAWAASTGYKTEPLPGEHKGSTVDLSKKTRLLDARSDIYCLGATLYHLITGKLPSQKASEVTPLTSENCGPGLAMIINKAMRADRADRFQSAAEMLDAINHIHITDPRAKKFRLLRNSMVAIFSTLIVISSLSIFTGLKRIESEKAMTVFAVSSLNELNEGDISSALDKAYTAASVESGIFTPPATSDAIYALTSALGVYDLSDGFKPYKTLTLPSAPLYMVISPSGKIGACLYSGNIAVFDIETAQIIATLPADASALSEVEFASDDVIVYAGSNGICAYDIKNDTELWRGKPATAIALSSDGKKAAAVYKDEKTAAIYDMESGTILHDVNFNGKYQRVTVNDSFANPNDNLFALNNDGTLLGVSFADGSLWVYDLENPEMDLEIFDTSSGYTHFEGGFFERYFAFSATKTDESSFAIIDMNVPEQTGGFESAAAFSVQADESGIYVQTDNLLVKIHPVTGEQTPLVTTAEQIRRFARSGEYTIISAQDETMFFNKNAELVSRHEKQNSRGLIQIADNTAIIGSLDTPVINIMKLENHSDTGIFIYDPSYQHDEARLSADGSTVMFFSFNHFRLYDINGSIINEAEIPDADQIYDQQYRRDKSGSRLDVIYNDGTILSYSAADGEIISETSGEKPDLTLNEEFFTAQFKFESPLHGTPAVYDKESGKFIRELEKDAYLTYVTQTGNYIITEYITTENEQYGLLLNEKCETLAKLPNLCDIVDGSLIFDYSSGDLRKSSIYGFEKLKELAETALFKGG